MTWIVILLWMLGVYLVLGLFAGGLWLAVLAPKQDPVLGASPRSVRLLLYPGAVALWPILLFRRHQRQGEAA